MLQTLHLRQELEWWSEERDLDRPRELRKNFVSQALHQVRRHGNPRRMRRPVSSHCPGLFRARTLFYASFHGLMGQHVLNPIERCWWDRGRDYWDKLIWKLARYISELL
jgi:hypothetical protein